MQELKVGNKCPIPFSHDISIIFDENGILIGVKLVGLTPAEIRAFKSADLKISLCRVTEQALFFVLTVDDFLEYSDIAFSIKLTKNQLNDLVEMPEGKGYAMKLILIEGATNIIKAFRLVGLSTEFSNTFNEICRVQDTTWIGKEVYDKEIMRWQKQFSPKDLVMKFEVQHCEFKR